MMVVEGMYSWEDKSGMHLWTPETKDTIQEVSSTYLDLLTLY